MSLKKDWYDYTTMENFHCKYITHYFHVVFCSSVCCFITVYVSISLLRNVEGETPPLTPVRSKEVWLLPFFLDGFRSLLRM